MSGLEFVGMKQSLIYEPMWEFIDTSSLSKHANFSFISPPTSKMQLDHYVAKTFETQVESFAFMSSI